MVAFCFVDGVVREGVGSTCKDPLAFMKNKPTFFGRTTLKAEVSSIEGAQ
jgi:hypothetical protein